MRPGLRHFLERKRFDRVAALPVRLAQEESGQCQAEEKGLRTWAVRSIGLGAPTVMISMLPASVMGDNCVCVGPPDSIIKGSATVLICKKPAIRMGDSCSHGGTVVLGCPTVSIGG